MSEKLVARVKDSCGEVHIIRYVDMTEKDNRLKFYCENGEHLCTFINYSFFKPTTEEIITKNQTYPLPLIPYF